MHLVITLAFFLASFFISGMGYAQTDETPPKEYISITVNGLDELAGPVDRLATAIKQLADSDKLSEQDQQKIKTIVAELHGLSSDMNNSIQLAKDEATKVQNEITDSISALIVKIVLGLVIAITVAFGALYLLIKSQVAPMLRCASNTVDNVSNAIEKASSSAEIIAAQQTSANRRFARKQKLIN